MRIWNYDVAVIGQGYVGLELAMNLVGKGKRVLGIEKDPIRKEKIEDGISPVENVDSQLLKKFLESNYFIESSYLRLPECETIIICVPTPLSSNNAPDLSLLGRAVDGIAKNVSAGALIINESTSYPGTLRNFVEKIICQENESIASQLDFAVAPERINPGSEVPYHKITRVVSGTTDRANSRVFQFYSEICDNVHLASSAEVAEMSKLLENTYRQINISFINEFSILCHKAGIAVYEVIEAAGSKPYGFSKFYPGAGIGGHCIPVDPLYLQSYARGQDMDMQSILTADSINRNHPKALCQIVLNQIGEDFSGRVLVVGVAYKSGLSDTRETPATEVISILRSHGITVSWHDPLVESFLGETSANLSEEWNVVVILVDQPGFQVQDLLSKNTKVFDFTGNYINFPSVQGF